MNVGEALDEIRPEVAFDPAWREVVRRSRRPRGRIAFAAAAVAALVVVGVTPAVGLRGRLESFFDLSRGAGAAASWHLAGPRVHADGRLLAAARLTHVDPATLRRVSAGGSGWRRVVLIGGLGPDRRPWLAQEGPGWVSNFFPLFGAIADVDSSVWHTKTAHGWDGWHFPMYARNDGRFGIFPFTAYGGSRPDRVTWATVVGFVRSDVVRLSVVTESGETRRVQLRPDGGFAYAARMRAALPRELRGYDAHGRLVAHVRPNLDPV
jgi:hypothetical protein